MSQRDNMKRLLEERSRLAAEIEALRNKLDGIDTAIKLIKGEDPGVSTAQPTARRQRSPIKDIVLKLLGEHAEAGLTSNETCEIAAQRGIPLDRPSVSSLLSRLKREEILVLDGSKYRLANVRAEPATSVMDAGGLRKLNVVG